MKECFSTFPSLYELIVAIRIGGAIRKRTDARYRAKVCFMHAIWYARKSMPRWCSKAIEAIGALIATAMLFVALFVLPAMFH